MNLTQDQLFALLGEQFTKVRLLEQELAKVEAESRQLQARLRQAEEEKEQKKEKK